MVSVGTIEATVIGLIAVLAGLYQFYDNRMGGLRRLGTIDRDSEVSEGESVLGIITGLVLIILGSGFLLLGILPLFY